MNRRESCETTHGILSQTLNVWCIYLHLPFQNKPTIDIPYIKRLFVWHGIQGFFYGWVLFFSKMIPLPTVFRNHFESFLEGPRSDSRFTRCSAGCQSGRSPRRWILFWLSWGGIHAGVGWMDGWMVVFEAGFEVRMFMVA